MTSLVRGKVDACSPVTTLRLKVANVFATPKASGLLIAPLGVLAIIVVREWNVLHTNLMCQPTISWVFQPPNGRLKVFDDSQGSLDNRQSILQVPFLNGLCNTKLRARGTCRDYFKIPTRVRGCKVPLQDVGRDGCV